ncbi:MAG: GNAT family N-acetyltransferase [Chthoniobacterales bacterium]
MSFEIVPAHDIPLAEQARVFSDAFSGYVGGTFAMDAAGLARFICGQGADLCHSRFVRDADGLCGFGYITRTGDIARLAGMGVIAAARRSGIARRLLAHLLEEAEERADRMMVLEVIEQNSPADALYRSSGFSEVTRLLGWRRTAAPVADDKKKELQEISLATASQFPSAVEYPDLSWAISRHAFAKMVARRAYTCGAALVVTGDPDVAGPGRSAFMRSLPLARESSIGARYGKLFSPCCGVIPSASSSRRRFSRNGLEFSPNSVSSGNRSISFCSAATCGHRQPDPRQLVREKTSGAFPPGKRWDFVDQDVDRMPQFVHVKRLRNHQINSEPLVGLDVCLRQMRREDGDLAAEMTRAQFSHQLEPGDFRHFVIGDHDIEVPPSIDFGQGRMPVAGRRHFAIRATQDKRQELRHGRFVFNGQDSQTVFHAPLHD